MKALFPLFLVLVLFAGNSWGFLGLGDDEPQGARGKIQDTDFEEIDLDGDNNVSPAEFSEVIDANATLFQEYDLDGDDLISKREFQNVKTLEEEDIQDLSFEDLDLDGDNNIDTSEFVRVYQGNQVESVFSQFDADNDEAIGPEEFDKLRMQLQEGALTDEDLQQ